MTGCQMRRRRAGFTLVELMTVIVIIIVLVGILLPAVSAVRKAGMKAASQSQLTSLASAIQSYATSLGSLPGYIDESLWTDADAEKFSGNENLVLSLLGRVVPNPPGATGTPLSPAPPKIASGVEVDLDQIGLGPQTRTNRRYDAFYSPKEDELAVVDGIAGTDNDMPEFVDPTTSMPILYFRAIRPHSVVAAGSDKIVGLRGSDNDSMFILNSARAYVEGDALAPRAGGYGPIDQLRDSLISTNAAGGGTNASANLAWFLINLSISKYDNNTPSNFNDDDPNDASVVAPKGTFFLVSPGPDGIYFSKEPLVGSSNPDQIKFPNLDEFDDVIVSGGN